MAHLSVLKKEVLNFLAPKENENFIDATGGGGGHVLEILKANGPDGEVLCLDWDAKALSRVKERIAKEGNSYFERLILAEGNFKDLKKIAAENNFKNVSGILADLGLSSDQLEESGRGFSFLKNEKLDMRFSEKSELTAEKIVNEWPEEKLEEILRNFGEEKFSRQISKEICRQRRLKKIETTNDLIEAIALALPLRFRRGRLHFATRTFQALRLAVNGEMDNLKDFLPQSLEILESGGRLAVISFHSLEDRIVKNFFKEAAAGGRAEILTKKPVSPSLEEIKDNPRSRSAKLRAILKK